MIHTTKWTCDEAGNWSEVPVILRRVGKGWQETQAAIVRANTDRRKDDGR